MTIQEKLELMYSQLKKSTNPKRQKDLYKGIKRLEGKRRKNKLEKECIIII